MLWLPVAAMVTSAALSLAAFARVWPGGERVEAVWSLTWAFASIGGKTLTMGLALDPLAAATLLAVTVVASCVQVYSLGYMRGEKRVGWYFAVLSLFTAAMLGLVLSSDLLFTFMMWEMMGLCSYLLIGFWYELEAPRKASQKAFLTTRVGDLGFLIALFTIYNHAGDFKLAHVLETAGSWAPGAALIVATGLLWAAMGKSAQVPLHVWLPDAMAGPTPASALIHAATMVAAGVFVVARTLPIFEQAPVVMTAMLGIGVITALLGGLLACVQHDIKKVAAYSTISQLGLMFVALGAGHPVAGLFHLTTHAFFKSLIFLGAGVFIHATHTQDMREMGGLAKKMPISSAAFTVGLLALAGVPPFAGFFSKDDILATLLHEHHYVVFGVVVLASAITAFYVARMWFRMFLGPEKSHGAHEGHPAMVAPMVLLAAITAVLGFGAVGYSGLLGREGEWPVFYMLLLSIAVAGTGFFAAWWVYGRRPGNEDTAPWRERLRLIYVPLTEKLYFDRVVDRVLVPWFFALGESLSIFDSRGIDGAVNGAAALWGRASQASWRFDGGVIDGAVNGVGNISRRAGAWLRGIQTGQLQTYQRLVIAAVVLLMLYFVIIGKGA
jgi:NADH-quinone oxidoreductase subunit L